MIRYLSIGDAAERLGVSVDTVKGWRHRGDFPRADAVIGGRYEGWNCETVDGFRERAAQLVRKRK